MDTFVCDFLNQLDLELIAEATNEEGKVGSKRRFQWYKKSSAIDYSSALINPDPAATSLYEITLTFIPTERSDVSYAYAFEHHPYGYGLITNADISETPDFLLKSNNGHVVVSVGLVNRVAKYSKAEIENIKLFQRFLSEEAYGIPVCTLFAPVKQSKLLVVPMRKDEKCVDFPLITKLLGYDRDALLKIPSASQQVAFKYVNDSYRDAMVVPWCRRDLNKFQAYFVEEICPETCLTPVPNCPKETYKRRFESKMQVKVLHPEAPLLRCYCIGKNRNFLLTQNDNRVCQEKVGVEATTSAGSKKPKWSALYPPELVHVSPIPASLLLQGRFMPSIIHRINRLCMALMLKYEIARLWDWDVEEDKYVQWNKLMTYEVPSNEDTNNNNKTQRQVADAQPCSSRTMRESMGKANYQRVNDGCDFGSRLNLCMTDQPRTEDVIKGLIPSSTFTFASYDAPVDFTTVKGPSSLDIMEALTLLGANDTVNMETLEVMGDSVLKVISSAHLFTNFPEWTEGRMTDCRSKLVSNEHLYLLGKRHKLGEHLSGGRFDPDSTFLPPGFEIADEIQQIVSIHRMDYEPLKPLSSRELANPDIVFRVVEEAKKKQNPMNPVYATYTHGKLSDKSVADAMEALIGTYYLHGGLESATRAMYWLGLEGPLKDGDSTPYIKHLSLRFQGTGLPRLDVDPYDYLPGIAKLEEILDYSFGNKWILVQAFTHMSHMNSKGTGSYERLEFIGDAVLDFLITDHIIKETGLRDPGQVTDLKAALVNNQTFGRLSLLYGFHKHLIHHLDVMYEFMTKIGHRLQTLNGFSQDDLLIVSTDGDCETVEDSEVPKVLGDLFESIIGAIFVDSKFSFDAVWRRVYRLMKTVIESASKDTPKSALRIIYELFNDKVEITDLTHLDPTKADKKLIQLSIKGTSIRVKGTSRNIKQAKQAAAKLLLRKVRNMSNKN